MQPQNNVRRKRRPAWCGLSVSQSATQSLWAGYPLVRPIRQQCLPRPACPWTAEVQGGSSFSYVPLSHQRFKQELTIPCCYGHTPHSPSTNPTQPTAQIAQAYACDLLLHVTSSHMLPLIACDILPHQTSPRMSHPSCVLRMSQPPSCDLLLHLTCSLM